MLNLLMRSPALGIGILVIVSVIFGDCVCQTIQKDSKTSNKPYKHTKLSAIDTSQNFDSIYQLFGSEDGVIRLNKITGERKLITWKQLGFPENSVKGVLISDSVNTAIDDYGSKIKFDGEKWVLENKKTFPNRSEFYGDSLIHKRNPIIERENNTIPSVTERQGTTTSFDGEKWIIYDPSSKMSDEEIILGIILDDLGKRWKIIKK